MPLFPLAKVAGPFIVGLLYAFTHRAHPPKPLAPIVTRTLTVAAMTRPLTCTWIDYEPTHQDGDVWTEHEVCNDRMTGATRRLLASDGRAWTLASTHPARDWQTTHIRPYPR